MAGRPKRRARRARMNPGYTITVHVDASNIDGPGHAEELVARGQRPPLIVEVQGPEGTSRFYEEEGHRVVLNVGPFGRDDLRMVFPETPNTQN